MTLIGQNSELDSQQPPGVAAEDELAIGVGYPHRLQTLQHFGDTADLVWIVAAGEDLAGAGEADGQLERARIEVNRIVEKLFEIRAWRARDVGATVSKGLIAAVKPLRQVRNGAAEMAEHPFDVGKSFRHAA